MDTIPSDLESLGQTLYIPPSNSGLRTSIITGESKVSYLISPCLQIFSPLIYSIIRQDGEVVKHRQFPTQVLHLKLKPFLANNHIHNS